MRIVNSYNTNALKVLKVVIVAVLIAMVVLELKYESGVSIGTVITVLILVSAQSYLRSTYRAASHDAEIISDPIEHVEKSNSGITYNGKQLSHYRFINLTHSPFPFADERNETLWLHPKHFNASKESVKLWTEAGGIWQANAEQN